MWTEGEKYSEQSTSDPSTIIWKLFTPELLSRAVESKLKKKVKLKEVNLR